MKKSSYTQRKITNLLIILTTVILCLSFIAYSTRPKIASSDIDLMNSAVNLTKQAFDILYYEKQERGIETDESDITHSGVIGCDKLTAITTTDGSLSAKRVSTNPNFAALFVYYLRDAGVTQGDEVGLMFSSSFPALNIACIAACEVIGAKVCLMNSLGASVYGATDVDFTFLDMMDVLVNKDVLHTSIRYLSFGGENDIGADFHDEDNYWIDGTRSSDEIKQMLRVKAQNMNIPFGYETDFTENIAARIQIFQEEVPNMKIFISVGGSICSLGTGINAYIETGYRKPSNFGINRLTVWDACPPSFGLLQYFHAVGIPVVSLLNIEQLATDMHMDSTEMSVYPLGVGDMYTETKIGIWYPFSVIATVTGGMIILVPLTMKIKKEKKRSGTLCSTRISKSK